MNGVCRGRIYFIMIDDSINHEYIIRYIRDALPKSGGILAELEEFAAEHDVPVSQPESIKLIEVLTRACGFKKILEIGSAIGYSALRMARISPDVSIDTIEINPDAAAYARRVFERAGVSGRITLLEGDAAEILPRLEAEGKKYDMIFLDAAKAQYGSFFASCLNMLKPGAMLISDNILYKGMTATDELVLHRKRTIVKRLREYVAALCGSAELDTAVIPVGDGMALSVKKAADNNSETERKNA